MIRITQLHELPKTSGIYRVIDFQGVTLYIGQARNIHDRWCGGHHKLAEIISLCGVDAHITWVQIPEWLLNRAESAAVFDYQPKLNARKPPVV
jgi:excinuclease UvrABC nuclease subunit